MSAVSHAVSAAVSPAAGADGVTSLELLCNGQEVGESVQIVSIRVHRAVNQLPSATLVLLDGDMPNQAFPTSHAGTFVPGAEVEVRAGYGSSRQTLFKGIVVKHALQIQGDQAPSLTLECQDKAVRLTVARTGRVWTDTTDGDLLKDLLQGHGLEAAVDATPLRHRTLVQHGCTDWEFLLSRAEALGLWVLVQDGLVKVTAPAPDASPVLSVAWGVDIIDFQAELDATHQFSRVQASAWDPASQAVVQGAAANPVVLTAQGNLSGARLGDVLGLGTVGLQAQVPMEADELGVWAKVRQVQSALARVHGRVRFQGSALAQLGAVVTLAGVGSRFSGAVLTTGLTHNLADGQWQTQVAFGLAPTAQQELTGLAAPAADARVPGAAGLHVGVVVKLEGDPQAQHRVQVNVPSAGLQGVWARLAQVQASAGFGTLFVPELGDEVLLGWLGGDPAYPVVLGSLYSSAHPPAYALQDANTTRAIVTRGKSRLVFDDADHRITLTTAADNRVVISDQDKSITLTDQHGNQVALSAAGIVLDSPKDVVIRAKGRITLEAEGEAALTSRGDVKVTGLNVACTAGVAFTGKGSATAELSAGGQTTVKGAMVMIN